MSSQLLPRAVRKSLQFLGFGDACRKGPRRPRPALTLEGLERRELMSAVPPATVLPPDAYECDQGGYYAKPIATDGTPQVHSINTPTDIDWVKFTLAQKSDVTIRTDGASGETDLTLYNPNGAFVAYNYHGNGTFARIDRTGANALEAGTYYVKVNEHGSDAIIPQYTLKVQAGVPADAYECDQGGYYAKPIATDGTPQVHSIHTPTDIDWVEFTLAQKSDVTIRTDGASGETDLTLYNPNGAFVAYNYHGNGTFSRIDRTGTNALEAGTYYVKVNEHGSDAIIPQYTLKVQAGVPADAYEYDQGGYYAKPIATDGTPQVHSINTPSDIDWVKFTLAQKSDVTIRTDGASGETDVTLYKSTGAFVAYNYHGNGTFSRIDRTGANALEAGTYYVKVNEHGSDAIIPQYTLKVQAQAQVVSQSSYMLTDHWGGKWTDDEKSPTNSDDDMMCWAAATSNMLVWTGWAQAGVNYTADQLFQYYCSHFSDDGNYPHFGIEWWFDGKNGAQGWSGWAQVETAGGNFYPSQSYSQYTHVEEDTSQAMAAVSKDLQSGSIAALGIYTASGGAHAITCWGYDVDPQTQAYKGVWVTDSDDDMDKTNPPDQLRFYNVQQTNGAWHLVNYYGSNDWYVGQVTGLDRRPSSVAPGGVAAAGTTSTSAAAKLPPVAGITAGEMQALAVSLRATDPKTVADQRLRPAAVDLAAFTPAVEPAAALPSTPTARSVGRAIESLGGDALAAIQEQQQRRSDIAGASSALPQALRSIDLHFATSRV